MSNRFHVALVGNPNSGKTTLFNRLTGTHQQVGNWPGVTVERKTGAFRHSGAEFSVTDLPGTFSLHVEHGDDSIDQQIAQQFVLAREADLLINVIDASSLERGLYLSSQLFDASVPMVIALNMVDVADAHGIHVDPDRLSKRLGCPVVPIIASRGEGIKALLDTITSQLTNHRAPPARLTLDSRFENALRAIQSELDSHHSGPNSRLVAAAVLERDAAILSRMDPAVRTDLIAMVDELETQTGGRAGDLLIAERYRAIGEICDDAIRSNRETRPNLTDRLDRVLLNRWLAFPIFLAVMYLMFVFTINIGGAFIDFFDIAAAALVVEAPRLAMQAIGLPEWLTTLLADGVGGGIQLVASFVPVIAALFLFQSFLEDSGYMARAAFILDRSMRAFGLPGKSFVPLIVGFGCNVPSIMATRSLDTYQDRLLTSMMAPFMSCGARLTVYALFAAALFPTNGQNVVFALYLIGIALAVLTGFLLRRGIRHRDLSPFILELPAYHLPSLRGLAIHTWYRLKGFVLRAGKAIVAVVIVLNFVNSLGVDGSFGNQNRDNSALSLIGKTITPAFEPMGVTEDNWPATVGIFTGIFAKEVVVGTLDALYTDMAGELEDGGDAPTIADMLVEAWDSVGTNLAGVGEQLWDPLGLSIGDVSDIENAADNQEVRVGTLTLMAQLFDGQIGAFSYILFVLLYMPCVATLGAIYKEMGGFWAFFSATWNTVIAYSLAVVVYQSAQPASTYSIGWIGGCVALVVASYLLLMHLSRKQVRNSGLIPVLNI